MWSEVGSRTHGGGALDAKRSRRTVLGELRSWPTILLVSFCLCVGIPVTVAIGNVQVATREAEGSIAAFSSRGLVLDGSLKPDLAAPGVSVPTSEPGRGDDGDVRFGTISGTSAAAAVTVRPMTSETRPP